MGEPNYSTFASNYLSYAERAAKSLNLPVAAILAHWYQEWGIPYNNPAWQTWAPANLSSHVTGHRGAFPIFDTLDNGVSAYIEQMKYYNDGSKSDIFSISTNLSDFYNYGYAASGKTCSCTNDSGNAVTAIGVTHYGTNNIPEQPTPAQMTYYEKQALYSVLEGLGASKWDAGHYFSGSNTQPGQSLINIVNNSGWQETYNYI